MTGDAMHQINIDACSEEGMNAIYKKVGYPFPLGPVIPRPDPSWPPMWRGMVQDGLDRQRAAAELLVRFYLTRTENSVSNPKGELITRMDYAFRNWWTFLYVDLRNNPVDGWQISQPLVRTLSRLFAVIEIDASEFDLSHLAETAKRLKKRTSKRHAAAEEDGGAAVAHDPFGLASALTVKAGDSTENVADPHWHRIATKEDFLQEILDNLPRKLAEQVEALYQPDDDGKIKEVRKTPLIFSAHVYARGWKKQKKTTALSWAERTDDVKQHVQKLLDEPAGEWNVFVLLFLRLLHIHMAWIVPPRLGTMPQEVWREATRAIYYRPLLDQLGRCVKSNHPLSSTAAGIHQTLGRVGLLMGTGPGHGARADFQGRALDPRDPGLPDCLHIDSPSGVHECLGEVIAILEWRYEQDCSEECTALIATAHEVAALAQELASVRSDPFALGGVSLASNAQQGAMTSISRFMNDWLEIQKGAGAVLCMLNGKPLSKTQRSKNLNRLPLRWTDSVDALPSAIEDSADKGFNQESDMDRTVRALEQWLVRPNELYQFLETTLLLFDTCGLDRFQSKGGVQT